MAEVSFTAACDAPVAVAFEYLDDYRNVLEYWHGMTSYRPVGQPDHGLGSVFEAVSKIGPSTVKSTIKTVEWEQNERVVYRSVSGMESATFFRFAAVDENHCTVEFRITFRLPGGVAGRALEKTLEPFVSTAARNTAENISKKVGEYHAAGRDGSGSGTADIAK